MPLPLRDFFRNPEQTASAVSPDGRYLSWLAPYERGSTYSCGRSAAVSATRVTSETARDIGGYFWKGERSST